METIEHKERVIAGWFYTELQKLNAEELEPVEAIWRLNSLLERMILERTSQERLAFSTMFARMAYVFQRHEVPVPVRMNLHYFRQQYQQTAGSAELATLGLNALAHGVRALYRLPWPAELEARVSEHLDMPPRSYEPASFEASLRVLVEGVNPQEELLLVRQAERPEELLLVRYNEAGRNELFNQSIRLLGNWIPLPVEANLLDVEIDQEGLLHPRGFVWCPDYLMDVSAVAECFNGVKPEPMTFLLSKFSLPEVSKHLVLGNIANFFLDELMSRPEATFAETFPKVFQLAPLSFCLLPEAELREIQQRSQRHFLTLKEMVQSGFKAQDIDPAQAWLEPSFYSARHGLQGRLDVFYHNGQQAAIVELKSGSAYMANSHRIGKSHFVQTLLYDLLIRAVYGNRLKPLNYILYSKEDREALRYAPRETWMQYEALELRNHLMAIEQMLIGTLANEVREPLLESAAARLFRKLCPEGVPKATGFTQRNLQAFSELWQGLSSLEQKYWIAFSGFIAREQQLAKTGVQGLEGAKGQASLWLNTFDDKDAGYEIMAGLELEENRASDEQPELVLRRTEHTNPLANFRAGDIAVLYPAVPDCRKATALEHQLIKGSVVRVDAGRVTLRLRSKQFLTSFFDRYPSWNLEHDLIDSSFRGMYQALCEFAGSPRPRRDLLMGLRAPAEASTPEGDIRRMPRLTDEQQRIFRQLVQAPEYFLLWGPPGTGKTSVMLKALVQWLLEETQEQVLLLAYTNRAVDEICESIERIGPTMRGHYLRIGSSNSTADGFQEQLFQQKMAGAGSRKAVLDILEKHRLVVGTVASLGSRQELFRLKKFDRIIIDEASQILEPMLCGLLLRTPKFVLIGDHLQLPAVVTQDEHLSAVADTELQAIGMGNLRNSLFERLYKRCQQQGWHWAYAQLSRQGRMHGEIMDFPNRHFYGGTLQCLPEGSAGHTRQLSALSWEQSAGDPPLLRQLASRRVMFLPTPADDSNPQAKTNRHEAELILTLIRHFKTLYQRSGKPWLPDTLGVITPYRAQIAQIQDLLSSSGIEEAPHITVDTVERYQGGARDIILISLCTNRVSQLNALSSLSEEGIDRKLNVALTRAREQLVLLGNPEMLEASAVYRALMGWCG
jgi:DNA replication ATP-dependent helicase Dna2